MPNTDVTLTLDEARRAISKLLVDEDAKTHASILGMVIAYTDSVLDPYVLWNGDILTVRGGITLENTKVILGLDSGPGIDVDRIAEIAERLGLVSPDCQGPDEDEVVDCGHCKHEYIGSKESPCCDCRIWKAAEAEVEYDILFEPKCAPTVDDEPHLTDLFQPNSWRRHTLPRSESNPSNPTA